MIIQATLSSSNVTIPASLNAQVTSAATGNLKLGHALTWDEQGRLAVQVAESAEADNTLPITAAAVQTELGNISVLLGTI